MLLAAQPKPYRWDLPRGFPTPRVPADNPMTEAKVELGRYLFYDRRLSGNGSQSCAACHDRKSVPDGTFSDFIKGFMCRPCHRSAVADARGTVTSELLGPGAFGGVGGVGTDEYFSDFMRASSG